MEKRNKLMNNSNAWVRADVQGGIRRRRWTRWLYAALWPAGIIIWVAVMAILAGWRAALNGLGILVSAAIMILACCWVYSWLGGGEAK